HGKHPARRAHDRAATHSGIDRDADGRAIVYKIATDRPSLIVQTKARGIAKRMQCVRCLRRRRAALATHNLVRRIQQLDQYRIEFRIILDNYELLRTLAGGANPSLDEGLARRTDQRVCVTDFAIAVEQVRRGQCEAALRDKEASSVDRLDNRSALR